ncbi:MAG: hypothetical protein R2744_12690 [Bacteroidales bacterium]
MTDGGTVNLESGFRTGVIQQLLRMGHRIEWDLGGYGGYQAIMGRKEQGLLRGI